MKKIVLTFYLLLAVSLFGFSQSTLKIYTELPDESAKFIVFLNGEKQDAVPDTECEIGDLQAGKYDLRVVFNGDSISDYVKNIKIPANTTVMYKVVYKGEFGKESGKMGRAFGRKTGTTGDDEKPDLIDMYRLEKVD